jgi:hypothetical protein
MIDSGPLWGEICDAIYEEDVATATKLLQQHPELIPANNAGVGTWLHIAASCNNLAMVDMLLSLGCDINAESANKPPIVPISEAIRKDNPAMLKALLDRGANPNHESRLLIGAIAGNKQHSLEMVKILDQYGADLHKIWFDKFGAAPVNALSTAIAWGKQDVVEYLQARGCVLPPATDEAPPPAPQDLNDEVRAFFTEHFGPVQKTALLEIVPTEPSVAIEFIPPSPGRKYVTLFTTGLSSYPMQVPAGKEKYSRAELFIQLPPTWKYRLYEDPIWGWPHHWLRTMAQYPEDQNTWFGGPALVVNVNEPVIPNTDFTHMLLFAERQMTSRAGDTIWMYRLTPLYREEAELEQREDLATLFNAFDRESVPFVVDLHRKNVALSS